MIIYSKTLWGLPLLTRLYGSALPRAVAPAIISGMITALLLLLANQVQHLWSHPYAYQPFVLIVSFVLTFRSNYAYQRHWEAYTQVQIMTARWLDAATQVVMFDKHPLSPETGQRAVTAPGSNHSRLVCTSAGAAVANGTISNTSVSTTAAGAAGAAGSHQQFVAELVHLISLLHGVCCQALRRDPDLANLTRHSKLTEAPPTDPALLSKSSLPGSSPPVSPRAADRQTTDGSAVLQGGNTLTHYWSNMPFAGGVNIVGAANWRDIFMLRGNKHAIRNYNAAQPLPVIGGIAVAEAAALGCTVREEADRNRDRVSYEPWAAGGLAAESAAKGSGHQVDGGLWGFLRQRQQMQRRQQEVLQQQQQQQQRSYSFTEGLGAHKHHSWFHYAPPQHDVHLGRTSSRAAGTKPKVPLHGSIAWTFKISLNHSCCRAHLPYMDRPVLVMAWLQELLMQRQAAGGLRVPAPVLTRVYTCLSDGLVGFEQCRKLADTPFPFPWAQFVLFMLVLFTITLPLLVLAYVNNHILAVVLTVVTVAIFWAVNEVARDVEDPFLYEPNDMPLATGQYHFNEMLLALAAAERPYSGMTPLHLYLPQSVPAATAVAAVAGVGPFGVGPIRVGSAATESHAATAAWDGNRTYYDHDSHQQQQQQQHSDAASTSGRLPRKGSKGGWDTSESNSMTEQQAIDHSQQQDQQQ